MSIHSFEVEEAQRYGMLAAALLFNIRFWCEKNRANQKHIYDGKVWTYNSVAAFGELFPYATAKQIRTALDLLEQEGVIECGNYNQSSYDRTKWYSVKQQVDLPCRANGSAVDGKSNCLAGQNSRQILYTDTKPDTNTAIAVADGSPLLPSGASHEKPKGKKTTLKKWIEALGDEQAIRADDPIFAHTASMGLPEDFLALAWFAFKARYIDNTNHNRKTYIDWRAAFRDHVKGNYLKLWAQTRDGGWYLTDAGKSAQVDQAQGELL